MADVKHALEAVTLNNGSLLVRPAGTLGTCGWSPKAWQVAIVRPSESCKQAFLRANPNWLPEEVHG